MAIAAALTWRFETLGEEETEEALARDRAHPDPDQWLLCAACAARITHECWRTSLGGAHDHEHANPRGIVFRIGCFREAPGCAPSGEGTEEWTWFPGYAWQVALCRECLTHLGWRFRARPGGEPPAFHGLIVDRLRASKPSRS